MCFRIAFLHLSYLILLLEPVLFSYAAGVAKFGFLFMTKIYFVPYWINVMWLDVVTYLHHTDKEVWEDHRYKL